MDDGDGPISSPPKAATPAYYRSTKFPMWFKLDDIHVADADAIKTYIEAYPGASTSSWGNRRGFSDGHPYGEDLSMSPNG